MYRKSVVMTCNQIFTVGVQKASPGPRILRQHTEVKAKDELHLQPAFYFTRRSFRECIIIRLWTPAGLKMFLANGMKVLRRVTFFNSLAASLRCRKLATERTNYISVTVDPEFDGSVAIVKMQKKPVNSLCANFFQEITKTIDDLENNENMQAMIITSAFPGVFSAGLDFNFLLGATYDDVYNYWGHLQEAVLKSYGSRLITICALNGHCMAGGNLFSLTADYRIMAEGPYKVTMNETQLGLVVSFYLRKMLENLIGTKAAARALQLSSVFTSEEACKIGWVEEVVPMDQILTAARRELKQWLGIPDSGRTLVKMDVRRKEIQEIIDRREEDAQLWASLVSRADTQEKIRASINSRKKK